MSSQTQRFICSYCGKPMKPGQLVCCTVSHVTQEQLLATANEGLRMKAESLEQRIFTELNCTEELSKEFIKIVLEMIKTFDQKQHDYGSHNIADFGEFGVLVRTNDKVRRLKNLSPGSMAFFSLRTDLKAILDGPKIDGDMYNKLKVLSDKWNKEPKNESIMDTWKDLSVYGVIAQMCRRGVWK